jgi:hypothetical protein
MADGGETWQNRLYAGAREPVSSTSPYRGSAALPLVLLGPSIGVTRDAAGKVVCLGPCSRIGRSGRIIRPGPPAAYLALARLGSRVIDTFLRRYSAK